MMFNVPEGMVVRLAAALAALCVLAAQPIPRPAAAPPASPARVQPGAAPLTRDPLDTAFRFATALEADPNDQALAQGQVVTELIALGRLDEAGERAGEIKGWR